MVKLELTCHCECCEAIELVLRHFSLCGQEYYTVHCIHEKVCRYLANELAIDSALRDSVRAEDCREV